MEEKTLSALHWIVEVLNKHNIPYRIGGGFAAHVYGSERPVNDIDISLSGKYFPVIASEVSEYITSGPKHYSNEKWDCDTLSINYKGQEIDITDIDTLRMSSKDQTEWFQTKEYFRKYDPISTEVEGIMVQLIDPRDLVAYKKHLTDREYQIRDVEAVQKYITQDSTVKMIYKGVIIEESLSDVGILKNIHIISTDIEMVTDEHKTPWIKQWTVHAIEITEDKAEKFADELSRTLDREHDSWYVDFKNDTTHFIVFKGKVFKIDRSKVEQYNEATRYGISIGIPSYQVDFAPNTVHWEK